MPTVRDLVTDSLRLIGVIASGETPSASEMSDSVRSLRRMLQTMSIQGLLASPDDREVFLTTPGKSQYTFGPTGDFNTSKPSKVLRVNHTTPTVNVIMTDPGTPYDPGDPLATPPIPETPAVDPTYVTEVLANLEIPVEIIPNVDRWAELSLKTTPSTIVTHVFIEDTAPLMTLNVWPVPSIQAALVLYSQKSLDQVVDADTVIQLPEGYEEMIVYNLAIRLAPEFGKQIDSMIMQTAMETKAAVKIKNAKPVIMKSDAFGMNSPRTFNIMTGYNR